MRKKKKKYAITYFIVSYGNDSLGVAKKVRDQIEIWNKEKIDFNLFVITDFVGKLIWESVKVDSTIKLERKGVLRLVTRPYHLICAARLTRDILYIRETFPIPYWKFKRDPIWIMEIQTIQENELRLRSYSRFLLYKCLQKWWKKKFEGVIFISNELSSILQSSFKNSRSTVISNGINLERFQEKLTKENNHELQFLFIGTLDQKWQGLDQLLELASLMIDITFNIVGETKVTHDVTDNVVFHGALDVEQYVGVAQQCTLAFGTLNQLVTGMIEASPLKVREYLALGLPVVIRYSDTDFQRDHDFLLKLPVNDQRLVDFKEQIFDFSVKWKKREVKMSEITPFISASIKESQRLEFFNRILLQKLGQV